MAPTNSVANFAKVSNNPNAPATGTAFSHERDELDELFDYDPQPEEASQTIEPTSSSVLQGSSSGINTARSGDLGIDEAITVRKPRALQAKLDEDRLLSANGIPKLRRISKERLRFRGKGHEFSDVSRLLNTYQLWLDNLFPKAKFADGITIIEKLGHKKRIQVMRRAWIEDDRYKSRDGSSSDSEGDLVGATRLKNGLQGVDELTVQAGEADRHSQPPSEESRTMYTSKLGKPTHPLVSEEPEHVKNVGAEPDKDELDALFAEGMDNSVYGANALSAVRDSMSNANLPHEIEFADDEEAMAEMDTMW